MNSETSADRRVEERIPIVHLRDAENDCIEGTIPPELAPPGQVRVECNNRPWAQVPIQAGAGPLPAHRFSCQLPPITQPEMTEVRAFDAVTGKEIGQLRTGSRRPVKNLHGLLAHDVLSVHAFPFFAVPWMHLDGAELRISGVHSPPAGDPSTLQVRFPPGVSCSFEYPFPCREWSSHFWYWPNAHWSAFVLRINLPASSPGSDPFAFEFSYPVASPIAADSPKFPGQAPSLLSRRVWIPQHLAAFVGFPREISQLTRVQTWSNDHSVTMTGYNAFKTVEALLSQYGVSPGPGMQILDWGCGHGRVARHCVAQWPQARIVGLDIDAENIAWCRQNLHAGAFEVAPLWPPSSLGDASIDAVFGISVMTHLTAAAQQAWLEELHRILKPKGLALLSYSGPGGAAWSSVFRSPAWWSRWMETGFDDDQIDHALSGKTPDETYYRTTYQSAKYTLAHWSRYFEILDVYPDLMGNQDVAVMRRR